MEAAIADIKRDIVANHYSEIALVEALYDGLQEDLVRLERRLDLKPKS